jgi:hypothetical protein
MSKPNAAQRRLRRVREAFSRQDLVRICSQTDFSDYATRYDLPDVIGRYHGWWRGGGEGNRFFYYRDSGSPILAVAHLDHVQADGTCRVIDTPDGPLALSGALDDRLGAYVILELLPKLGISVDVLLTTNEEMGASTASDFHPDHKQYNWMIEFDRGGTDVVMYQYETPETCELVRSAGARVGVGSYSDIADLEHLGCAGFNWGVGYYDYHSRRSHAWLEDTFSMVAKFVKFYSANAGDHLPYDKRPPDDDGHDWLTNEPCPDCQTEFLDRWGCCWSCGFDIDAPDDDVHSRANRVVVES